MFKEEQEMANLKAARRQNNEFVRFFKDNHKSESLQTFRKPRLSSVQFQGNPLSQRYRKDPKEDPFKNTYISNTTFTRSENLDKFLQQHQDCATQGSQIPIGQVLHNKYMKDPNYSLHYNYQMRNNSLNNSSIQSNLRTSVNQSINKSLNKSQSMSKQTASYAFSGPPRFWVTKNSNQNGNTTLNEFVQKSTIGSNNVEFLDDMINNKKLNFNKKVLKTLNNQENESVQENNRYKNPKSQRSEMIDRKNQEESYSQWKKQQSLSQKSLYILKNGYKSGVLGTDGPFLKNSKVYQQEYNKISEKNKIQQQIQENRIQNLEKYLISNPDINFDNTNKEDQKSQTQRVFPQISHEFDAQWKSRRALNNPIQQLPTFQNCFGHNLEDQKQQIVNARSQHLRFQDTRGKIFNPVTGVIPEEIS